MRIEGVARILRKHTRLVGEWEVRLEELEGRECEKNKVRVTDSTVKESGGGC